jgi:hypothetical protein
LEISSVAECILWSDSVASEKIKRLMPGTLKSIPMRSVINGCKAVCFAISLALLGFIGLFLPPDNFDHDESLWTDMTDDEKEHDQR